MRVRRGIFLRTIVTLLILAAAGFASARAAVRQADDPIVDRTTRAIIENLPGSGTDLPLSLSGPRDVYLFVTAGAAYTDVRVLADLSVSPEALARALERSEAGTSLAGGTVEWSADRYAAAHLVCKSGRLGRRSGGNMVPMGALIAGLRRAGFVPYSLLRIPRYAQVSGLPHVMAGTEHYRWYDGHALARSGPIAVNAWLRLRDFRPFVLLPLSPLVCLLALGLALRVARDQRRPLLQRRRLFQSLTNVPLFTLFLSMPVLIFVLRSPDLGTAADLWFGSGKSSALVVPLSLLISLTTVPFLLIGKRREVRLFGKPDTARPWLSEEEQALQKRMQKWSALPHLLGMAAAGAVMFLVPHKSPVYSVVHPLSQFFMIGGAALVSQMFRKQAAGLTRKSVDDDLTFRARRFGPLLGARPREVWIEDSSRAAHFIGAFREKDHIIVTRKMRDELSPAEMDFVLAQHVAALGQRRGMAGWSALVMVLPLLLVPGMLILMRHPTSGSTSLILSPWFLPTLFAVPFLGIVPMLLAARQSARIAVTQEQDADRKALEATGDLAAALGAVSKLEPLPPRNRLGHLHASGHHRPGSAAGAAAGRAGTNGRRSAARPGASPGFIALREPTVGPARAGGDPARAYGKLTPEWVCLTPGSPT